jgi:hypothetical protein
MGLEAADCRQRKKRMRLMHRKLGSRGSGRDHLMQAAEGRDACFCASLQSEVSCTRLGSQILLWYCIHAKGVSIHKTTDCTSPHHCRLQYDTRCTR